MRYGRPRRRRRVTARRRPVRRPVRRRRAKANPRAPKKPRGGYRGTWKARKAKARKAGTRAGPRPTGVRRRRRKAAKKKTARKAAKKKTAPKKKKATARKRAPAKRKTTKRRSSPRKRSAASYRRAGLKRRRGKLTKAQRRAAALKGWRKRRSKMARKVSKRRKSYKRKRKHAYSPRRRKPLGQRVRRGYRGRRSRRKGRGGRKRAYGHIYRRIRKHRRKGRLVRAYRRRQNIRTNPMTNLKRMVKEGVYTFGGILGIRALCQVLKIQVFDKVDSLKTGTMQKIAPMLPAGVAMLLAALAPKVIKGSPKLVQGLQAGATLVFFDAALKAVLDSVDTTGKVKQYLLPGAPVVAPAAGWGGYHEYVASPMGLEVESAMALDEYVASPSRQLGMGDSFDVEEALAGNEGSAFETGYAGGSLAKTVFSNY